MPMPVEELRAHLTDAFPGAGVAVSHHDGRFELHMRQHGLLRPLKAAELSDGTLRYLLWIAALLTPRPPRLPMGPEGHAAARRLVDELGLQIVQPA